MENNLVKLCGLWENETRTGGKYLSGKLGSARLLIFPNKHKQTPNHPDFTLFLAPVQEAPKAQAPAPPAEMEIDEQALPF